MATGRSPRRVRDALRALYGTLPAGIARWELDPDMFERAKRELEGQSAELEWPLEIGDTVRRREIHRAFGGQEQGGISTPRRVSDIFIFTDPASGQRYGYDRHEGLRGAGTCASPGEGQRGPQSFVRGHLAIRDAAAKSRVLRVFVTKGPFATYVGAFTTGSPTYRIETIPDLDGEPREGIIFNLVPLSADLKYLPAYGAGDNSLWIGDWRPPEYSDIVVPAPELPELGDRVVSRAEFQLQSAFGMWLGESGHPPKSLRLPVGSSWIEPDLFIPSKGWIVEAKKSSGRAYVRTAIGQVLDYVHIARRESLVTSPLILLPGRPEQDLVELVDELGIILSYRRDDGFAVVE